MPVTIGGVPTRINTLTEALRPRSRERRASLQRESELLNIAPPLRNDLLPTLRIEQVPLDQLRPPLRQVRKFGPGDVAAVANVIRAVGVCAPIIIGRDGQIIDGTLVGEAARSLGLPAIPCVRLEHLSKAEERLLRQALNRLGKDREWDIDQLRLELQELQLEEQPLELTGFTAIELDQILLPPATTERLAPEHAEPDMDVPAVTRLGDVWRLNDHLLLCGDAKDPADHALLLGEDKIRLTLTDPPYAVAVGKVVSTHHRDFVEGGGDMTQADFEQLIRQSFAASMTSMLAGAVLMSFMDWKHVSDLIVIGRELGLEHLNLVTWVKAQGGMGSLYRSQSEFVVMLKKPGSHVNNVQLGKYGRDRTNVWQYAGAGTPGTDARAMLKHHPTPKPVQMLADAILDVTERGDIVLDPFGGSGSTLIACEQTDRQARLIELDPRYCDLIIRRWQDETGRAAVLDGTDRSWEEVAEERLDADVGGHDDMEAGDER